MQGQTLVLMCCHPDGPGEKLIAVLQGFSVPALTSQLTAAWGVRRFGDAQAASPELESGRATSTNHQYPSPDARSEPGRMPTHEPSQSNSASRGASSNPLGGVAGAQIGKPKNLSVGGLSYLLYFPAEWTPQDQDKWPLLVFLHGQGESRP